MTTLFRRRVAVTLNRYSHQHRARTTAIVATSAVVVGASYYTRQWRNKQVQQLELAKDVMECNIVELLESNVKRAGLMGTSIPGAQSVREELDTIREWHKERGYHGGLVLRELTQRLFVTTDTSNSNDQDLDLDRLHQRECYYLYYEIRSNGEIRQQIFCRGTTLLADVLTCIQSWWTWDEELQCKLHNGFKNHADRLLQDVEPLLAPPTDSRATVELCGHSLGGAVAFLVAMKLKQRGYNVIRVTSVGAPRTCHSEALPRLSKLLPPESFRIEDDCDIVPYLPPFGAHLGNKLWFMRDWSYAWSPSQVIARYIRKEESPSWIDSVWVNLRFLETIIYTNKTHRVPSYVSNLNQLAKDIERPS